LLHDHEQELKFSVDKPIQDAASGGTHQSHQFELEQNPETEDGMDMCLQ
jgi:hypothetical protein